MASKNIKVREILHHGQTRHERVVEVYAITEDTVRGILLSSPYAYDVERTSRHTSNPEAEFTRRRKVYANMIEDLQNGEYADFGWSRFDIIE